MHQIAGGGRTANSAPIQMHMPHDKGGRGAHLRCRGFISVRDLVAALHYGLQVAGDQQRGDGHGADCQLARAPEQRVGQARQERAVQAVHGGQARQVCVAHALGHHHEAHGDARHDIILRYGTGGASAKKRPGARQRSGPKQHRIGEVGAAAAGCALAGCRLHT